MSKALSILIVTTSHDTIGDTGKPTGVWLEELTTPYYIFLDAGASVMIASIKGGAVPIDPSSTKGNFAGKRQTLSCRSPGETSPGDHKGDRYDRRIDL